MNWYINVVKSYPLISAVVQFSILGTLGDVISKWIIREKIVLPYSKTVLFLKMAEWAVLAVFIKYAFIGFHGFVDALISYGFLPGLNALEYSFAVSVTMNLQFGPFLVITHRLLDNLVHREKNWANLDKGFLSLLWFWIPAHTLTFVLPKAYQIGLAAVWSVVLGIILGYYNRKN